MSWTTPITWTAGQVVGASDLNAQIRDNMNFLLSQRVFSNIRYLGVSNKTISSATTTMTAIDTTNLRFTAISTSGRVRGGWGGLASYDDSGHTGNMWMSTLLDGSTIDGGSANSTAIILHGVTQAVWYPFGYTSLAASSHTYDMAWRTGGVSGASGTLFSDTTHEIYGELEEL